jgi:hypothetical protein
LRAKCNCKKQIIIFDICLCKNKIFLKMPFFSVIGLNGPRPINATVPLMLRRSRGDKDTEPGAIHNT